ncbi:hypothetical protein IAU59_001517 [Kwoniella sp. CBS 9459]
MGCITNDDNAAEDEVTLFVTNSAQARELGLTFRDDGTLVDPKSTITPSRRRPSIRTCPVADPSLTSLGSGLGESSRINIYGVSTYIQCQQFTRAPLETGALDQYLHSNRKQSHQHQNRHHADDRRNPPRSGPTGRSSFSTGLWIKPDQALNYPSSNSLGPSSLFRRESTRPTNAEENMTFGVSRPPMTRASPLPLSRGTRTCAISPLVKVRVKEYPLISDKASARPDPSKAELKTHTKARSDTGLILDLDSEPRWSEYTLDNLNPTVVTTYYRFTLYDAESCSKPQTLQSLTRERITASALDPSQSSKRRSDDPGSLVMDTARTTGFERASARAHPQHRRARCR